MVIYISGAITNTLDYKERFSRAEEYLKQLGHAVLNPATLPLGLGYDDYMHIGYAMIDCSDAIYMIGNWTISKGANLEYKYAYDKKKMVIFEEVKNSGI